MYQTKRKTKVSTEAQEQIVIATWLAKNNILFYHIPNGGRRNLLEAIKFKRMGVQPGVPDVCIPLARKGYHGAYGELKRVKGGVVSEAQRYWLAELAKAGYYVFVAKGADEFINCIKNYLKE